MHTYELSPIDRKSFYGKAQVTMDGNDGTHTLVSYSTKVASYNPITEKLVINGWYSMTTARHINAFLHKFGLPTMTKKQMLEHDNQ